MDANNGNNNNPNKRKLTAREILDQIREEAEKDKLEAEKPTLKRDSKNLELPKKQQPELQTPSPRQNGNDNSFGFGDHQGSNHNIPEEGGQEEIRPTTHNMEGTISKKNKEDSKERKGNDNNGQSWQPQDGNPQKKQGNNSQTHGQSKAETTEKRSFDEKMMGLESLRQKLLENKRVNEGLKEEFEGLRSEIQEHHTDRSKGKDSPTDNIQPQEKPQENPQEKPQPQEKQKPQQKAQPPNQLQPQQKPPSNQLITLIVPEKRKVEEPYKEPKEAHKEASEYLRNYRKSREKIEEGKEEREVPLEKEAEVSFSEEKEAAKTENSIKKLEELIKMGSKEEKKLLIKDNEVEFKSDVAGEELDMQSPVFKDKDSSKDREEKGYDDWKDIQKDDDPKLWKSDQEMPRNRGSLNNKNKKVAKDAHPIEKNIQIKVLEPVYKKETPKHDELKESLSNKEEPKQLNDPKTIKEASRPQTNYKDPQPKKSNQGPSKEAFRKDPNYPLRDQVEYPQTTKNRRENPYNNAYFESPSTRSYEDRPSVTQRLVIDKMQKELQEKERLILWLENQRQETESQMMLLQRKVDDLQEENDGLLRMNFELTREKSALKSQLDSLQSTISSNMNYALSQKSPKTTLYSTQASHFSAKVQPNESLTNSFRNTKQKEDMNLRQDQFKEMIGDLLKIPNASWEEILGEIDNLQRLRGLGEEIKGNVIFQGGGLRGKLEKIEAFFRLFGLDPKEDFLERVNGLFNEFVRLKTFLRVNLIWGGFGGL